MFELFQKCVGESVEGGFEGFELLSEEFEGATWY